MIHFILASTSPWVEWRPASCWPADCFCETVREGVVRQPVNTWSSLAFLLAALFVMRANARGRRAGAGPLGSAESGLFGGTLVLIGLGSAFFHASLSFVGQVVDVSSMYFIATFMLLHRLGPRWGLPPVGVGLVFLAMNAALMAAQVMAPAIRRPVFGVLLLIAIGVEWTASRAGRWWLSGGAGTMAIAFAIWGLDRWRFLCAPESLLQGHAVWHVLGALAAICLFRSYEADA